MYLKSCFLLINVTGGSMQNDKNDVKK